MLISRENYFSCSQHSFIEYNFLRWLRPCDLSAVTLACLLFSLLSSSLTRHVGENMGITSYIPMRRNLSANSLVLQFLSFYLFFTRDFETLGSGMFCRRIHRNGMHNSALWLLVAFCNDLYLWQR